MANNKTNIVNLPLTGVINQSKSKLDIIEPGHNGFLKNDGVVYGNTLSPVYRTSKDPYDVYKSKTISFNVGNASLVDNNNNVISTFINKYFDKETLNITKVSTLYNKQNYARLLDTYFEWHKGSSTIIKTFSTEGIGTVLAMRLLDNENLVVFYKDTLGDYKVKWYTENDSDIFTFTPASVGAPLITCYHTENFYLVSVISDSGAEINAQSLNLYKPTNGTPQVVTFNSTSQSPVTTTTYTKHYFRDLFEYKYIRYSSSNHDSLSRCAILFQQKKLSPDVVMIYYQTNGNATTSTEDSTAIDVTNTTGQTTTALLAETIAASPSYTLYGLTKTSVNKKIQRILNTNASVYKLDPVMAMEDSSNTKELGFIYFDFGTVWDPNANQGAGAYVEHFKLKFAPKVQSYVSSGARISSYLNSVDWTTEGQWYYTDGTPYENDYVIYTAEASTTPLTSFDCDAVLDNGAFITLKQLPTEEGSNDKLRQGAYCFTGTFDHFADNKVYYTVTGSQKVYLALDEVKEVAYPYYLEKQVKSLGFNYFRDSILTKGYDGETTTHILYDSGFNKAFLNPGYNTSTYTNGKGSVASQGKWRVLYNNNYVSGISYSEDSGRVGTLLTDWLSISSILSITENDIYYLDNYGKVQHIEVKTNATADAPYSFVENRFIVINTTSYYNCFDVENNEMIHYAPDYNNRFQEGAELYDSLNISTTNQDLLEKGVNVITDASAINANFEMTNNPLVGLTLAAEILTNALRQNINKLKSENSEGIDYYLAIGETNAVYEVSYKNGVEYKNTLLEDAVYPTNTPVYNPNIFTKFIKTYNQRDMAYNEATNTAYPLMKYNGQLFLSYTLSSGLENAENIFVIQTLHYMISRGFIYEIYYNGEEIQTYQAVLPVEGLEYLGCLPTEALFWCQRDRCVYSFAGDAIMNKRYQWNEISNIYKTWYAPDTQELFISSNRGLLCISNTYQYLLEDINPENMTFLNDTFILQGVEVEVEIEGSDPVIVTKDFICSYEYNPNETYDNVKTTLQTDFVGSQENFKSKFECLYIRLFHIKDNASFKIKATTITDMGATTDEKSYTLDETSWDSETNSVYLRFQPQYQSAVAIKFNIETDAPIISMGLGYMPLPETAQLSHINI